MKLKIFSRLFLYICMYFLMQHAEASAAVWLQFRQDPVVNGPDIFLGDIAAVYSDDGTATDDLTALKIGNAAAPGAKVVFTARLFELRFLAASGGREDVAWQMERPVVVTTAGQNITGAAFTEAARLFLDGEVRRSGEERKYTLEALTAPNAATVPKGKIRYEFSLPYGVKYSFPTNVAALVYVDDQLWKKSVIRFKVHVYDMVAVAARPLRSHDTISAADVRMERLDASGLAQGYLTDASAVVGKVARRMIAEGTPFELDLLDKPIIMQRSAEVRIISSSGDVQVEMEGQALQDGREGDWIRVKNTRSGKILSARVIDAVTVDVSASKGR